MKIRDLIRGLTIIGKYADPESDQTAAQHDIFFVGPYEKTHAKMTEAERLEMEELGFFESEESWAFFT